MKKLETESDRTLVVSKTASSDNAKDGSSSPTVTSAEDNKPELSYKLPLALEGIPNLPPSVLPPSADAFVGELLQWG